MAAERDAEDVLATRRYATIQSRKFLFCRDMALREYSVELIVTGQSAGLKGWKEQASRFAIRPIQQFSYFGRQERPPISRLSSTLCNSSIHRISLPSASPREAHADFTPSGDKQLKANWDHDRLWRFAERKTPDPL
jgi:hypothetical protein